MTFDLISTCSIMGSVNGIFTSVIVISFRKAERIQKYSIAAFLFLFGLLSSYSFLMKSDYYLDISSVMTFAGAIPFLLGPLIYLYVKSLVFPRFSPSKILVLHILPFAAYLLYAAAIMNSVMVDYHTAHPGMVYYLVRLSKFLHMLTYILMSLRLLRKFKGVRNSSEVDISGCGERRLNYLIGIFSFYTASYFIYYFLFFAFRDIFIKYENVFFLRETGIVFIVSFLFLTHSDTLINKVQSSLNKRYRNSCLSEQQKAEYLERLLHYMRHEKPYLNSNLSLEILAKKIHILPKYLSQIINEHLNQNYSGFIKSHRIEEAKRLIRQASQHGMNMLDIAYEVGFNTKSVFNAAFKKHVGMTPSEYQKISWEDLEIPAD